MTLGRHGVLSPAQARDEAKKVLGDVARGLDPASELQKKRARSKQHNLGSFIDKVYSPWAETHLDSGTQAVRRMKACFKDLLGR